MEPRTRRFEYYGRPTQRLFTPGKITASISITAEQELKLLKILEARVVAGKISSALLSVLLGMSPKMAKSLNQQ